MVNIFLFYFVFIWTKNSLIFRRRSFFLVFTYFWTDNPLVLQRRPFFLDFAYFWYEKGCHHKIPPRVPPSLATPLKMPSTGKFWNLKSLLGAPFHTDHFGMINSFWPKSDFDIYFIRLDDIKNIWSQFVICIFSPNFLCKFTVRGRPLKPFQAAELPTKPNRMFVGGWQTIDRHLINIKKTLPRFAWFTSSTTSLL